MNSPHAIKIAVDQPQCLIFNRILLKSNRSLHYFSSDSSLGCNFQIHIKRIPWSRAVFQFGVVDDGQNMSDNDKIRLERQHYHVEQL